MKQIVIAVSVMLVVQSAVACRCTLPYKKRFRIDSRISTFIVYGKVVETDALGHWARIQVIDVFKSPMALPDTIEIGRMNEFTTCSSLFSAGTFALIYSTSHGPVIESSICSATISNYSAEATKIIDRQRRKLRRMHL
jgi:hypothetical protein